MKNIYKKLISLILVFVMALSMTNIAFAAKSGGVTKFVTIRAGSLDVSKMTGEYEIWLSDEYVKILLGSSDAYKEYKKVKGWYDTLNGVIDFALNLSAERIVFTIAENIPSIVGMPDPIYGPIKEFIKSNMPDIETANSGGNGVIITFKDGDWPRVRPQTSLAETKPATINLSVSPSGSGVLNTVNTLTPYIGSNLTVVVQRKNGWKFDGWYEGNTKVSDTQTYKFVVKGDTKLEAKFTSTEQTQSILQPNTQKSTISVTKTVDGSFTVTIPANTTVYGFLNSAATTKQILYNPKTTSYTLYCTKRLIMSDGTTRYLFRSGGTTARDWYLMFTSVMSVDEKVVSTSLTTLTPNTSDKTSINWDISSTVAKITLKARKTYEITNTSSKAVSITSNSDGNHAFDYLKYSSNGTIVGWNRDTYFGEYNSSYTWRLSSQLEPQEKFRITVNSKNDINCYVPYDWFLTLSIKSVTMPAIYRFSLKAGNTYEIINTSNESISLGSNSDGERCFDYIKYGANGTIIGSDNNTYFGEYNSSYTWRLSSQLEPQEKFRITVNPKNDINCFVPYDQASFLNGIPK